LFPCFVKPVKGSFSVCTRRVATRRELEAFLDLDATQDFARHHGFMFDRLLAEQGILAPDSAHFLAEEVLSGDLVTVEGFACGGDVTVFGVVDSVVHPSTRSFVRFEYPSRLSASVQERMEEIAARAVKALRLEHGLFNVELFHDPASGRIDVVEVNPRVAGQFGDLYEKVDGTSSYTILLALAAGEHPSWQRRTGRYGYAASVPLRIFGPARLVRAPSKEEIAKAEALFEGTLVSSEVESGTVLADFARGEDGASARYAVLNLGANDRAEVVERSVMVEEALDYRFEPLGEPS
jgi:biotin carboxylase